MKFMESEIENDGIASEESEKIWQWIEDIPLSRQKRKMLRDFSDGVLCAEIVHHFFPEKVDLHNYAPANSSRAKRVNWETLSSKVLRKLGIRVGPELLSRLVASDRQSLLTLLLALRFKVEELLRQRRERAGPARAGLVDDGGGSDDDDALFALCPSDASRGGGALPVAAFAPARRPSSQASLVAASARTRAAPSLEDAGEEKAKLEDLITNLEQVIDLKDHRIAELQETVERLSETISRGIASSSGLLATSRRGWLPEKSCQATPRVRK